MVSVTLSFGASIEPRHLDHARALLTWHAVEKLGEVADRDYIVVVDEHRGVKEVELNALVEKIADPPGALYVDLHERVNLTVKLYITTSDSTVASRISRSTVKYGKPLMWNLPRSSFNEAVEELLNLGVLGEPKSWAENLGLEEPAWSLFGGNVRELLEASNMGLTWWLERIIGVIRRATAMTIRHKGLANYAVIEELRGIAERGAEEPDMVKVYDAMLSENIHRTLRLKPTIRVAQRALGFQEYSIPDTSIPPRSEGYIAGRKA